jgi:aminoglycoside phosphotransferase family enzyme/predicted kinase
MLATQTARPAPNWWADKIFASSNKKETVPLLACKQCSPRFPLPEVTRWAALLASKQWHTFCQPSQGVQSMTATERFVSQWRAQHGPESVHETHLSWVLLDEQHAYKFKKSVDLGFADYSTLEKRHHGCEEELRLNRRLAPELYLRVAVLAGSDPEPVLDGSGHVLDYAVVMERFPESALLTKPEALAQLTPERIDQVADDLAAFHQSLPPIDPEQPYWSPDEVRRIALGNLKTLRESQGARPLRSRVERLEAWTCEELDRLTPVLHERKASGFVRECHGDLHLGNMILRDDVVGVFDCIEFNAAFRWIDVLADLAFLAMDLAYRNRVPLARRLLNRYLEATGDYEGIAVWRYYLVYRAIVRAMVAAIRLDQHSSAEEEAALLDEATGYVTLAESFLESAEPMLTITCGVSGSGKSVGTQSLVEQTSAIRIRADVERKRLLGLVANERPDAATRDQLYSDQTTDRTYQRLAGLAATILAEGWPVVIDATFLVRTRRQRFAQLAQEAGVPFAILMFEPDEKVLEERVQRRMAEGGDASDATPEVLAMQLASREPLDPREQAQAIRIAEAVDISDWPARLRAARESAGS